MAGCRSVVRGRAQAHPGVLGDDCNAYARGRAVEWASVLAGETARSPHATPRSIRITRRSRGVSPLLDLELPAAVVHHEVADDVRPAILAGADDAQERVLGVPFKRTGSRSVMYLNHEQIEAILASSIAAPSTAAATVRSSPRCQHRRAGSRNRRPVRRRPAAGRTCTVRLHGRKRRERVCRCGPRPPRALLAERGRELQPDEPVFRNHRNAADPISASAICCRTVRHRRPGQRPGPAHQAPSSPQHAAPQGSPPAPRRRRHRHDQSVARPLQRHDHAPLHHRRPRRDAAGSA